MAFCRLVAAAPGPRILFDRDLGQHRCHDEPACVDEPFQLLALDGASPAVTEYQRNDGGQAGRDDQRCACPAQEVEDVPNRPGHADGVAYRRGAGGDKCGGEGVTESPRRDGGSGGPRYRPPAAREQCTGGEEQQDEHHEPDAEKIHPAQPLAPAPGPGELQQQQPGEGDRIRQAGGGQEPPYRVRRAFPPKQRTDGGETHEERHRDRAGQRASRAAAKFRRQRVNLVVDQGCRGHRQSQHPDGPRAPECCPRRHSAAACGPGLPRRVRRHLSHLLPMIISPAAVRAEGCEPLPGPKATTRPEGKPASPAGAQGQRE